MQNLQTLFGAPSDFMLNLLRIWYMEWGLWLGLALALISAFVVFVDAMRQRISAMWWKVAVVVGVVLVIPSLVMRLSPNDLAPKLVASAGPAILSAFAIIGVLGALLGFLALITYLAWGRAAEVRSSEEFVQFTMEATPPYTAVPPAPATIPAMTVAPPSPPTQAQPVSANTIVLRIRPEELGMLVVKNGRRAGETFKFGEVASIGRDSDNEISIDDEAMSRHNAKIWMESEGFVIQDLASTNGTWVNKARVLKQPLCDGDEVQVGDTQFKFVQITTSTR